MRAFLRIILMVMVLAIANACQGPRAFRPRPTQEAKVLAAEAELKALPWYHRFWNWIRDPDALEPMLERMF